MYRDDIHVCRTCKALEHGPTPAISKMVFYFIEGHSVVGLAAIGPSEPFHRHGQRKQLGPRVCLGVRSVSRSLEIYVLASSFGFKLGVRSVSHPVEIYVLASSFGFRPGYVRRGVP